METFVRESPLPQTPRALWDYHARPGAFQRLTPPWETVRVLRHPDGLAQDGVAEIEVVNGPITLKWNARLVESRPGEGFRDVQESGPFAHWEHHHEFRAAEGGGSLLRDEIQYALPLHAVSGMIAGCTVRHKLARMFAWRHATTRNDLARQEATPLAPMRIAITGATGLVGSALSAFLGTAGHEVLNISRRAPRTKNDIQWNPDAGTFANPAALDGVDAVVHLAGENIAEGAWTAKRKQAIRDSRVHGTELLVRTLAALPNKPRVLISGSAIGIYGDTGDRWVDESAPAASGFLGELGAAWEAAAEPARDAGIRVAHLRTGIVLTPAGGALRKMLPAFRFGVGGRLGSGRQYLSWIAMDDLLYIIYALLADESISGPVNAVAPNPATNANFTRTLARVLRRPVGPPVPAMALRLMFGELADAGLLVGQRVGPNVLLQRGHPFAFPDLEGALRHVLGRSKDSKSSTGNT